MTTNSCILRVSRVSMGTEFQVILAGENPEFLRDAGREALDVVERLEERLSHYRPDSEICDLNRRAAYGPVRVAPTLFALLARAVELSEATDGAFDCTAGPLVRCWGFFKGTGRRPEPGALAEARGRVGSHLLALDPDEWTVAFRRPGVEVHLGAIGKGYAIDHAAQCLRELGVTAALIHGGTSSVYALGAPPGAEAWEVGVCDPVRRDRRLGTVRLRDRALSTSGDYEQFFEVDGTRYSHVLDPRLGEPARGVRSATVLAESATDTDALATAAFVLGPEEVGRIGPACPGSGVLLVPDHYGEETGDVVVLGDVDWSPEPGVHHRSEEREPA